MIPDYTGSDCPLVSLDDLVEEKIGVTFKSGMKEPIHRWFRLTVSYSPELMRLVFDRLGVQDDSIILDPFAGAGTTLIEARKRGVHSIGVEINPIFIRVLESTQLCDISPSDFIDSWGKIDKIAEEKFALFDTISLEDIDENHTPLPTIHNLHRWWRDDVLKHLLAYRTALESVTDEEIRQLLELALISIVIDVANIHRGHPTLTFTDRSADFIDVASELRGRVNSIHEDLISTAPKGPRSKIINTNSKSLPPLDVTHVITSPPYPNRYSYVWETRPQLFFMRIFTKAVESGDLDCETIGGTWGKATSKLDGEPIELVTDTLRISLGPQLNEIEKESMILRNYVAKYFNDMNEHLRSLSNTCKDDVKLAYVVGNSRIKGVEIYTDIILADIMNDHGFTPKERIVLRKRLGRANLYEIVLVAERS